MPAPPHAPQSQYRRPAKRSKSSKTHTLSQAELLAEAARTEIENIQSLKHLLAMEVGAASLLAHTYLHQ
jgi:hypothetical protein